MQSEPLAAAAIRDAIRLRSLPSHDLSLRQGQFRSKNVVRLLKNNGLRGSMGRVSLTARCYFVRASALVSPLLTPELVRVTLSESGCAPTRTFETDVTRAGSRASRRSDGCWFGDWRLLRRSPPDVGVGARAASGSTWRPFELSAL